MKNQKVKHLTLHVHLMTLHSFLEPASYVICEQSIAAIFVIINLCIVIIEFQKRRRNEPKFKSCSLKWLSLLSISGGFLVAFTWMIRYFNGLCLFMYSVRSYFNAAQPICVGLYQLSRLYQCSADMKFYGGYPKWLFYAMGTFGILYLVTSIPYIVANDRISQCHLTQNYDFAVVYIVEWSHEAVALFNSGSIALYLFWDITTLTLLVFKLRALTKLTLETTATKSDEILIGIQRNVARIVILTIFYMVMMALYMIWFLKIEYFAVGTNWEWYVNDVLGLLSTTSMSYAVFLMQPHNSGEYGIFLKGVICLRLHWCCCCCYRHEVVSQKQHFMTKYKAIYKITASGVELEVSLIERTEKTKDETGTAFNNFSMDEPPSAKYQAPTIHIPLLTVTGSHPNLEVVRELQAVQSLSDLCAPEPSQFQMTTSVAGHNGIRVPFNDFLFESESKADEEFATGFSFGVYLEYWRKNRPNSVNPKYKTLKQELTRNRYASITKDQYSELKRKCKQILRSKFIAKDIGIMNKICGIKPGDVMTVDHVICIKLYTDFTDLQRIFKKHCRRMYKDEPIDSLVKRNSEIAHWCRYLKECVMFWGERMTAKDTVYCGLNIPLIFNSLHQRFECPLSTTGEITVADQFSVNDETEQRGLILKLKRANPKTRYLNVAPFSTYNNEDERLFMGSTLKIVDIVVRNENLQFESLEKYISALLLLEHIVRGQFLQSTKLARKTLHAVLRRVNAPLAMDVFRNSVSNWSLYIFLDEQEYDTDAIVDDIGVAEYSNIRPFVSDQDQLAEVAKTMNAQGTGSMLTT